MRFNRWWQYGLLGGATLTLATLGKIAGSLPQLAAGKAKWAEVAGLLVAVFGLGFLCGVTVWLGKGLSRRFGLVGDALIGFAVAPIFFAGCMMLFAPQMLGEKLLMDGLPMLGVAGAIGLVMGVWIGRNLRRG